MCRGVSLTLWGSCQHAPQMDPAHPLPTCGCRELDRAPGQANCSGRQAFRHSSRKVPETTIIADNPRASVRIDAYSRRMALPQTRGADPNMGFGGFGCAEARWVPCCADEWKSGLRIAWE